LVFHRFFFFLSDAFLQLVNFLQRQHRYRNSSLLDLLNSSDQIEWFTSSVTGLWKSKWSLPFQMILTRWGICFSFNLTPLPELLHLDRSFEVESRSRNLPTCFVSGFPSTSITK
jgi:hypothetical protein